MLVYDDLLKFFVRETQRLTCLHIATIYNLEYTVKFQCKVNS